MVLGGRDEHYGVGVFRSRSGRRDDGDVNFVTGKNQYRVPEQLRTGRKPKQPHVLQRDERERPDRGRLICAERVRRHEVRLRCG